MKHGNNVAAATLVAGSQLWWEHLHLGNWQMLQPQLFVFFSESRFISTLQAPETFVFLSGLQTLKASIKNGVKFSSVACRTRGKGEDGKRGKDDL